MIKEAVNNNSIVLTLKDDSSSQLLESKKEEKYKTDSSSVELWIKSLKDLGDLTDDSRSDQDNNDSCSDQDDLQLGADATNLLLRKRQRSQKNGCPSSDSDDSKYSPRRSRLINNRISSQTSLESDTSGRSSVTSVSSLLTARESDPEEVLKGLGFIGPNILDNIPDRFITSGTKCQGIDANQFLTILKKDSMDSSCNEDSDLPPWMKARVDDIPKQFLLQSNNSTCLHSSESSSNVPLLNEPPSNPDDANTTESGARPPKTLPFPSKFGTFLEPVSEELELSSQGSVNGHSPVTIKNVSFESNRSSTLKANSQDEATEGLMKIPSLKDLWQSQPSETEMNSSDDGSEGFEVLTDDVVEYTPGLNSVGYTQDENQGPEDVSEGRGDIQGPESRGIDGVSKVTDDNLRLHDVPGVYEGSPWDTTEQDERIPTVLDCLSGGETPIAEDDPVSSDDEAKQLKAKQQVSGNHSLTLGQDLHKDVKEIVCGTSQAARKKSPSPPAGGIKNTLPIVTVTSPGESPEIPTVLLPDYGKLDLPQNNGEKSNVSKPDSNGKQNLGCKVGPKKTLQLHLYEKWVVTQMAVHPQIHISSNTQQKTPSDNSKRLKHAKVMVTKRTHFPIQIVLPEIPSQNIECFTMNLGAASSGDNKFERTSSAAISLCCSEASSGFVSLVTHSNNSTPTDEVCHKTSNCVSHKKGLEKNQGERLDIEGSCGTDGKEELSFSCREYYAKRDSVNFCSNAAARTDYGEPLKNEVSMEGELDGLQSSLKGVKLYKAGIHLMQLASSIESFNNPESEPVTRAIKSSQALLVPIQNELNHLEEHILYLQKQLTELKEQRKYFNNGERVRRESDFSNVTRQLLHEQLKMFNSISNSVSPSSTPMKHSFEETLSTAASSCPAEDPALRNDVKKLSIEIQKLRQENESRHSRAKNEILGEIKTEIKNCFGEFLQNFERRT